MTRKEKLHAFLEARRRLPHEFGKNDCCLFAADWIKLLTGKDPAKGLRRYRSEQGAKKILAEHGGLLALMTERLGEPDKPLSARVGDVVYGNGGLDMACGIVAGHSVAMVGADGLVMKSLSVIEAVWHV